jgi:gliding motility-associated-like protein
MKENLDMDGTHQVDEVFRGSLDNYTESPNDAAWSRLNRKLNRKEFTDFVTFKKTKVAPELAFLVPIYRKQWFRATIATAVIGPALFFTGYFIAREAKTATQPVNTENQQILNDQEGTFDHTFSPFSQTTIAENRTPSNMVPDQTPQDLNTVIPVTKDQSNNVNNDKRSNLVVMQTGNNLTALQIADEIRDMVNDPVIINNLMKFQGSFNKDSIRYHDARVVDSLIQANAILETEVVQAIDQQTHDQDIHDDNPDVVTNNQQFTSNEPIIIIPKAFTPNGDNLNDVLYIDGLEYYPDNIFVVHDAQGNMVYSKKEYRGDWTAEGVPDGLYFYFLTYKNKQRVNITIKGVVTIIR